MTLRSQDFQFSEEEESSLIQNLYLVGDRKMLTIDFRYWDDKSCLF